MNQKKNPSPVREALMDAAEILAGIAVLAVLLGAFLWCVKACANEVLTVAEKKAAADAAESDEEAILEAERYGVGRQLPEEETASCGVLEVYAEGDGPAPEWYRPEEAMAVEWVARDMNVLRKDIGCPDWNADTTLWGWDGHHMEAWEMDVFIRIFYLEYWGSSDVLCEAGCDAMLNLWDLNGGTMFESLSHVNENGSYTYSTFPGMWEEEYDPEGLAWCRRFCEERFFRGPVWEAQYFRKGQYHDWGEWSPTPAYEIDGIYFSIGR